MRALTWHGTHDVRVDTVDDPEIINPRDAILKITSTAICGSDLHLYDGVIPGVVPGDVLGHEFMGEVVETGADSTLKKGQRVVVPFTISCGGCFHCQIKQFSACENSNPVEKQDMSATLYGHPMAALFGYSHLTGGYSGGQAEYVRVPFSDVGPIVIPDHLEDEKVLFLSDILPTGWMGAENAEIQPDDTVAVWGCGPVGLFAIQSAIVMGASKVIAIDHYPHRLELAKQLGAEVIDFRKTDVREALMEMSGGIGCDAVIDAVGMEAFGNKVVEATHKVVGLLPDALAGLGVRGPEPLRDAFTAFGLDYQVSGRFGDCLDRLKVRLADPVGDRVCESLRVARDVGGGDLGRLLRNLSGYLREDARTRSELESRQAWTVNGARLAGAAPWLVLVALASASCLSGLALAAP